MRKVFLSFAVLALLAIAVDAAQAQLRAPYHPPASEGNRRHETRVDQGATYNPGRTGGGAPQGGISYPGYWTYNRFSNLGFGGLNYYYGPLGGYTPYVSTPYATTSYGYPNFGPYYSYVPLAPVVRQGIAWPEDDAAAGLGKGGGNQAAPARKPPPQDLQPNVKIFDNEPSPEALRKSLRYQGQGDEWFAKQNYLQAYGHYKQALSAAPARPEPRFRMAMALVATANYSSAVDEIKRAMKADPNWPTNGAALDDLFGAENALSKNAVLHKLAGWVREDIRDPDRLFLMGVLLHFNADTDKSHTFFEASYEMSPNPVYAQAFLEAEDNARANRPGAAPRPQPPVEDEKTPPAPAPARKAPEEPKPRPLASGAHPAGEFQPAL